MRLLKIMLIVLSAILVISSAFQLTSSLGFFLIICPLLISIIIFTYEQALMFPGIRLEFLLETQFLVAGILSLRWVWLM
jgi:4-hydroxy-3-methylbut-2-enyl diphosphate reductase